VTRTVRDAAVAATLNPFASPPPPCKGRNSFAPDMFYLKRNLPAFERVLRLALGAGTALAAASWAAPGWAQWAGYASAAMLAGTAVVGFCPACALVGRQPLEDRR